MKSKEFDRLLLFSYGIAVVCTTIGYMLKETFSFLLAILGGLLLCKLILGYYFCKDDKNIEEKVEDLESKTKEEKKWN